MSHRPVRNVLTGLAFVGIGVAAMPAVAHAAPGSPAPHDVPGVPHTPKKLSERASRLLQLQWAAVHASDYTVVFHNEAVLNLAVAAEKARPKPRPKPAAAPRAVNHNALPAAGGFVIDYAWTKPNAASIHAAGYQGVLRYLSHSPSKDLSAPERSALHAQGLSIGLNWETNETRALQGGPAGWQDAKQANARADALGAPNDAAIYFSCDTDVANPAAVRSYYRYAKAASKRPIGVYGERAIVADEMNVGVAKYGWVTNSGSWGPQGVAAPRAALQQFYGTQHRPTIAGSMPTRDYDENQVLRADWGQWRP